jgi:hypothetical protein
MINRLTLGTTRNYSRQGEIRLPVTILINKLSGFEVEDDLAKVRYSWQFQLDGIECAVWDYFGSWKRDEFSLWTAGSMDTLKEFLQAEPMPRSEAEPMPRSEAEPMPAVFRSGRN